MKTLHYCIRCHSLRDGDKKFNSQEITSIYLCQQLNIVELDIKKIVCSDCRYRIGDEIADEMLKQC